jgi:putative NADH-flavin reductase
MMKIAIFGASGWIGGTIAREALNRGHTVTAIVRDPARLQLTHERLTVVTGDVTDLAKVASVVAGHDAVAAAIGGRREGNHQVVPAAVRALLTGLPQADVKRLVWVGGGSSLEVSPGVRLFDTPQFPAGWKTEALAQIEALDIFRTSTDTVDWTYLSPPLNIEPGQRTGRYRTGGDQLLSDEKGESRISVEDFAVAFLDELEYPTHIRQRFTVAY